MCCVGLHDILSLVSQGPSMPKSSSPLHARGAKAMHLPKVSTLDEDESVTDERCDFAINHVFYHLLVPKILMQST